jgi:predicted membrane channel-forming protein YqfA (hemolysin III family)
MSAITDALKLLESESSIFAFLPAVNYGYYIIQQPEYQFDIFLEATFALLVSSFLYNFLNEASLKQPEESEDTDEGAVDRGDAGLSMRNTIIFTVLGLTWAVVFTKSLVELYSILSQDSVWPEILISASAVFVFLLLSDIILYLIVPRYGEG